jgi:uncharacterized cupin superfamily protein
MGDLIVKKLSTDEIERRGIKSWPIWEKEISKFPWQYDGDEECLILEGEVVVETGKGSFTIKAGDFVVFKKGLKCVWDIKDPIRKHYYFP